MRGRTRIGLVVGVLAGLAATPGWAGTNFQDGDTCVTQNPGSGAITIKATIAVQAETVTGGQQVDVTYRLERGGVIYFDRARLLFPLLPTSTVDFLCLILPHENNITDPTLAALAGRISTAFGFATTRNFCITDKSISKAESLAPPPLIPGTNTAASVGDVTIHAVAGICNAK